MAQRKENQSHPSQITFLNPEDAELVHKSRLALSEFVALFETRQAKHLEAALQIRTPADAFEFVRAEMEGLDQEQMHVLTLNTKGRIISSSLIYQGSLHTLVVRLAEIFRPALVDKAAAILVCHNHPSGDPEPSPEDISLTRDLLRAGRLLGIDLVDHLVIGKGAFVSLKERGARFGPTRIGKLG